VETTSWGHAWRKASPHWRDYAKPVEQSINKVDADQRQATNPCPGGRTRGKTESGLRLPHVAHAVALAVHKRLVASAPMALAIIEELARNADSPKVRLDAAKTLMDRAGHVPPRVADIVRPYETPLNEMSVEELKALATRLEDEVVSRATVVSSVTDLPVEELVDLMD
jgi:hypothetical protein